MRALRVGPWLLLLVLTACSGYTTTRLDAFKGARTIAVRPVVNSGFRRDLELRLGQALTDEIRGRTSYAFAQPQFADLILETEMTAGEEILVQGADRAPIQKVLSGTVTVRILDRRGRVLRTDTVRADDPFLIGRHNESLDGSATDEWTRRIAIRIVQVLDRGF